MSKTIVQQLEEANQKIVSLNADLLAAQKLLDESNESRLAIVKEKETLEASIKENAEMIKMNEEKMADLAKEISELKAKEVDVEKVASEKALEIAAKVGVPPVPAQESQEVPVNSKEAFLIQFNAISDPKKRAEFYSKFKSKIFKK